MTDFENFLQGKNLDDLNEINRVLQEKRKESFKQECTKYSDENGIKEIEPEILENYCLELPFEGTMIEDGYYKFKYCPENSDLKINEKNLNLLGKYWYYNWLIVFVNRDGRTFLAKPRRVLVELQAEKYKKEGMFIPLADDCTRFLDENMDKKWKEICQKNS